VPKRAGVARLLAEFTMPMLSEYGPNTTTGPRVPSSGCGLGARREPSLAGSLLQAWRRLALPGR
jgi:hypothetical protein